MDQNRSLTDITTTLAAAAGIDPAEVTPDMSIAGDLDIDSMTMLEVIVALEDQFGLLIPDDEWSRFVDRRRPRRAPRAGRCRRPS